MRSQGGLDAFPSGDQDLFVMHIGHITGRKIGVAEIVFEFGTQIPLPTHVFRWEYIST